MPTLEKALHYTADGYPGVGEPPGGASREEKSGGSQAAARTEGKERTLAMHPLAYAYRRGCAITIQVQHMILQKWKRK